MLKQQELLRPCLLMVAMSGLLFAGVAGADSLDSWNINAGRSVMHDKNLFHLADSVDTFAALGRNDRSDTVTTDTLGLKISKPYSLQRFELEVNLNKYSYQKFDYLNFTAANYAAAWRWSLTPALHGNLTSTRQESLNSFVDTLDYRTRNLRTDDKQRFDADLDLGAGWHLLGGVFRNVRKNSAQFLQERDNTLTSAEIGGRYDFTSGSSLGFINRTGRGTYDNQEQPLPATLLDNGFDQTENLLVMTWPVTAKTRIDARIGQLSRKHDHYAARDYSGTVGSLSMNWEISGKSRLNAGFNRNLASYETTSSSYLTADRFFFSPVWQVSAKTALRYRFDYIKQDYQGAITAGPANGRSDRERISLLAADWQALSFLSLSLSLTDDRRTSNQSNNEFKDRISQLSVQLTF
jgi:exopolysaccharide biosynthesis operon protein EpsL